MRRNDEPINVITGRIVDAAIRIHQALGPGLLESIYERILGRDLARLGYLVERQKPISFEFEGMFFPAAFRPDLIVAGKVVVEVKAAVALPEVYRRQLMTYLKILDLRAGLLLNFGAPLMKDGIIRIVHKL